MPARRACSVGGLRHTGIMNEEPGTSRINHQVNGPVAADVPSFIQAVSSTLFRDAPGGRLHLVTLGAAPSAQRRTGDADHAATRTFETALELRAKTGMPFWNAVFLTGEMDPDGVAPSIIDAALLHQPVSLDEAERVLIDEYVASELTLRASAGVAIVALLSVVEDANGNTLHLPMLDFSSKSRRAGAAASVIAASRGLEVPGSVVSSGRSFHFYGDALMTPSEHHAFLCRATFLAPITDGRWIGHQLLEGYSSLRISANAEGVLPELLTTV